MSQCEGYDMSTYVAALVKLKGELGSRFADFRTSEISIDLFARPFRVKVKDVPGNMKMELTDLQNNTHRVERKLQLWSHIVFLKIFEQNWVSKFKDTCLENDEPFWYFGSTYVCEQLFKKMNFVKSRSRLSDVHLENSLKVPSSKIRPDIDSLARNMNCQTSHKLNIL